MANFPGSPQNDQLIEVNGDTYIYASADGAWYKYQPIGANLVTTDTANIVSTVSSTSSTTGALKVAGGAGIAGNVYAGAVYTNSYFYANGSALSGGVGFTGSSGAGFTGSAGSSGFTGSAGAAGFVGSQGAIGFTGSAGSDIILTGTTTNATETEIFINGVANSRITVANNKSTLYEISIVSRRTDSGTESAAWNLKTLAQNNGGTVTDIGDIYEIIIADTDGNLAVDARADSASQTMRVYVTGNVGKTYSWKASVSSTEV